MRLKLAAAAALVVMGLGGMVFGEGRKPNVLVIVADDLGYADIGVQAVSKDVVTPNIDTIAKNGVRFTNGYVTCPVCSPSRAGFLTGRYQERFGHEANPVPKFAGTFGLPLEQVTIADEMRRAGYATGLLGKWHEGGEPAYMPTKRGFDEFFGFIGGAHAYAGPQIVEGRGPGALWRGEKQVAEKEYLTDAISREAVSFIDHHQKEPFFLYVAYNAVHTPQQAPAKYQDRFKDVKDEQRKMMLAMLAAEDDGVGQILAKVREEKLEENTLIVFFSDNGGPTMANGSRNAPFRGYKGQVWEGGIRIPFMMQWKGRIEPGQVRDEPVITLDLMPTALAAAGEKVKDGVKLDGVDLMPWLSGKGGKPHEELYWRFTPQWAVRDGDWKLVHTREGTTELFDLKKDPGETTDLSAKEPEVKKRVQGKFDAWNKELHEPLWPGKQEGGRQEGKGGKGAGAED